MLVFVIAGIIMCCKNDTKKPNIDEVAFKVAYANWVENDGDLISDENCLNVSKFVFSDYPRLPTFKFENKEELNEFKNKYRNLFTMDYGYDEEPSFDDITSAYVDDFFKSHIIILTYKSSNSGSYRYAIDKVLKQNKTLILKVKQLNAPEVVTDDMSGWFLIAEIDRKYAKDCTEFDTHYIYDLEKNYVIDEESLIVIPNNLNAHDSIDVNRIEEFIDNSNNGIDDEITITQYTIEGDPITTILKYNGTDGTFKMTMDTTQDKFGKQEITTRIFDNTYKAVLEKDEYSTDEVAPDYNFILKSEENIEHICMFRMNNFEWITSNE